MDHSFQTVEHDIIAEDKHLQSPFPLVQQHGLTGCARHVVDVGNDHAGKRLTIHNEVHIDGLVAALSKAALRRSFRSSGRPARQETFGSAG